MNPNSSALASWVKFLGSAFADKSPLCAKSSGPTKTPSSRSKSCSAGTGRSPPESRTDVVPPLTRRLDQRADR
eukprot:3210900-Pyramimonas_sp.AAC.1